MSVVRVFPALLRDRLGRAAAAAALGLLALLPRLSLLSGTATGPVAEGMRAGTASAGAPPLSGAVGLLLVLAGLAIWQGAAAGVLRRGARDPTLARPVSREAYFAGVHLSAVVAMMLAGGGLWAGLRLVGGAPLPGLHPAGLVAAAGLTGWTVGAVVMACRAALPRGALLASVAALLFPAAAASGVAAGWLPAGGPIHGFLELLLPPLAALREARIPLLQGALPPAGPVARVLAYGGALAGAAIGCLGRGDVARR